MTELVAGRFQIEREAGAGAMARVYRARDVTTDGPVALKVLNGATDHVLRRFEREVAALEKLEHTAIVRSIAHGRTASGQAFLAMEWLDGESLQDRLDRGPLSVADTLALGRALASALAAAHARGLVHRDVKPANIFLVEGNPARPKLLDFGLTRDTLATLGLTGTGDLLGTPLYMAPEQASCELDVDARADVYALGAVLYSCLAGRPPLLAPNLVALLAKIVLEQPPSLATLAPTAPPAMVDLVERMLGKQRDQRPADGRTVEKELESVSADPGQAVKRIARVVPLREQRVVTILLASKVEQLASLDATLGSGGGALGLADGSTMVVFSGPETPGDLASRAVRYALKLRADTAAVSLATGRALLTGPTPVGEVIDRAASQLASAHGVVRIDADTAALVEGRFELDGEVVVGERPGELDAVRTLLGKPTRCIGRDREVAAITGYYTECIDESAARAVIVVGDAGVGKSRLAREVLHHLASHAAKPTVLVARCESNATSSPFAAVATLLRRVPELPNDEFLAELLGSAVEHPSERMRAAKENPSIMYDGIRDAWIAWLRRACERSPVALGVEDLHWIDESSLQLLDAALGALAEQPLCVLALGRPEVLDRAQPVFGARRPHHLRLDPLGKRASERLVRDALGDSATDAIVADIVARAEGNALFLEELVRAAGRPAAQALPVGVIGTVQLRLDALRPETRALLRIASVYGDHFTPAGIAALVAPTTDVGRGLDELVQQELVTKTRDGFGFRHGLVREAAYQLLADDDRVLAHALAADYLVREGHSEPAVIAQHFDRGNRGESAATWYAQAANRARSHNDLVGALAHARRGQALTTDAVTHVRLDVIIADCLWWRGEFPEARAAALRAANALPEGTTEWFHAVGLVITVSGQLGDDVSVSQWLERATGHTPTDDDARSELVLCLARASSQLAWGDRPEIARRALQLADEIVRSGPIGPFTAARLEFARGYDYAIDGVQDACMNSLESAAMMFDRIGATRDAMQTRVVCETMRNFSGDFDRAFDTLRACIVEAERANAAYLANWARFELAMGLFIQGHRDDAVREFAKVAENVKSSPLFRAGRALTESWNAIERGDTETLASVLAGVKDVVVARRYRLTFDVFELWLAARRGEPNIVPRALELLDGIDHVPGMVGDLQFMGATIALELLVEHRAPEAPARIAAQRERLARIGARIVDERMRTGFLYRLPWNRRVHEMSA